MNIELGGENTNLHFRLDKTTIYTWQWENSQGLCLDVEVRYDTRYDIVTQHDVLNDNEPKHIIYARLQSVSLLYNTGDAISNPLNFFHNYCPGFGWRRPDIWYCSCSWYDDCCVVERWPYFSSSDL